MEDKAFNADQQLSQRRYEDYRLTKRVMHEIYHRVLNVDQSLEYKDKLRLLGNLFTEAVDTSKLTLIHYELYDQLCRVYESSKRMGRVDAVNDSVTPTQKELVCTAMHLACYQYFANAGKAADFTLPCELCGLREGCSLNWAENMAWLYKKSQVQLSQYDIRDCVFRKAQTGYPLPTDTSGCRG